MSEVEKLQQRLAEFKASRETFEQKVERYKQQLRAKQQATSKPIKPSRRANAMNTHAMAQELWQQYKRAPLMMMAGPNPKNAAIVADAMRRYHECNARLEARLAALPAGTVQIYRGSKK